MRVKGRELQGEWKGRELSEQGEGEEATGIRGGRSKRVKGSVL